MQLFDVSFDALNEITSLLEAYQIARLWIASPKSYRHKLEKGTGVRNWTLSCSNPKFAAFPAILPHFSNLQQIRLDCPYTAANKAITSANLQLLPPTVTSLELNFVRDADSFLDAYASNHSLFPNLRVLLLQYPFPSQSCASPNAWPATLERLEISTCFATLNVSALPANLSTFKGRFRRFPNLEEEAPIAFQGSITSLDLEFAQTPPPCALFGLLPKVLQHFHLRLCQSMDLSDPTQLAKLPAELKSCNLEINSAGPNGGAFILPLLPRTLESLSIKIYSTSNEDEEYDSDDSEEEDAQFATLMGLLPPYLSTLDVELPATLFRGHAMLLPRHLTFIPSWKDIQVPVGAVPFMPPNLQCMSVFSDPEVNGAGSGPEEIEAASVALRSFPLQHFMLSYTPELVSAISPALLSLELDFMVLTEAITSQLTAQLDRMKCLSNLTLYATSMEARTVALFNHLPQSLRTFRMTLRRVVPLEILEEENCFTLPPLLTSLDITGLSVRNNSWYKNLPSSLIHLRLGIFPNLRTADQEQSRLVLPNILPPSLCSLKLTISGPGLHPGRLAEMMKILPPSLTKLVLRPLNEMATSVIPLQGLEPLPPYLTHLDVPGSKKAKQLSELLLARYPRLTRVSC